MNVKDRLKKFIAYEKITIRAFEESINASNGYVNSIHRSIGLDKLELMIEKYSKLNIEWLLTGKGTMLKSDVRKDKPPEGEKEDPYIIDLQKKHIAMLEEEIARLKKQLSSAPSHSKPAKSEH